MSATQLEPRDVITALFPSHRPQAHEQEGYRPAIVLGVPSKLGTPRYDMVLVVPLTTDHNQSWANAAFDLYPRLKAGIGNLPNDSIVLMEQIRALHTSRMQRYVGQLSKSEFAPIRRVLLKILKS
jgi:mRNA interferase MazF